MLSSRLWLSLSFVIAPLALAASAGGLAFDRIYQRETELWMSQAIAQDIVNLAAYPALAGLAFLALRGSLAAYLAWLGVLVYSTYTFAIYAFAVQFGPLFLVHVAIFGLSAYALGGGLAALGPSAVRTAYTERTPVRLAGRLLIVVGVAFYALWLSGDLSAALTDDVPSELVDVGLATNPIHVLDMALLLPAVIMVGRLLTKGRALGYYLAPVLLTALAVLGVGIVAIGIVGSARGDETSWPVVVVMSVVTAGLFTVGGRVLRSLRADVTLADVARA